MPEITESFQRSIDKWCSSFAGHHNDIVNNDEAVFAELADHGDGLAQDDGMQDGLEQDDAMKDGVIQDEIINNDDTVVANAKPAGNENQNEKVAEEDKNYNAEGTVCFEFEFVPTDQTDNSGDVDEKDKEFSTLEHSAEENFNVEITRFDAGSPVHYLGAYRHPMPRHTAMFNTLPGTFDLCQKHLEGWVPQNRRLRPQSTDPP